MLKIATNGGIDYHGSSSSSATGSGNRLPRPTAAKMTSSAWRNLTSFCNDDEDEGDYASMMTSSTTLSTEVDVDCDSYETFAECSGRSRQVPNSMSDLEVEDFDGIQLYESVSGHHRRHSDLNRSSPRSDRNGIVTSPTGSGSTCSPGPLDDPFPELSQYKLAPVSARIYSCSDESSSPRLHLQSQRLSDDDVYSGIYRTGTASVSDQSVNVGSDSTSETGASVLVKFYTDDSSYEVVSISGTTMAVDVCHQLVARKRATHSPQWTLVERINRYKLERGLEHHELILSIYKTWSADDDCRFFFRKDFTKYELFRNPVQFFPENMVDAKLSAQESTLLTRSERYKNLLLQNLLANQSMPDIQGYVHIRDKRSWKKYFCVLRGTGLYYSTKGNLKDPQYLILLSTLEDVDIYVSTNAKKVFGAPTNYGFYLKASNVPLDMKQLRMLCTDDEQSRLCWTTGMRFVKYGAQLRNNFRLTLRYEEEQKGNKGQGGEGDNKQINDALYVKNRVAMDFSGERGRVVADPNEALTIAFEEGYNWRKRAFGRSFGRPVQPSGGGGGADPRVLDQMAFVSQSLSTNRQCPPLPVASTIHLMQPWFHGQISRDAAVSLISEQGLVDGVFLIRNSQSIPNVYVLSFAHHGKVKHCTINKIVEWDGHLCYSLDNGVTKFMDLIQLVDFYQLNAGALPTTLTYHVTRL